MYRDIPFILLVSFVVTRFLMAALTLISTL